MTSATAVSEGLELSAAVASPRVRNVKFRQWNLLTGGTIVLLIVLVAIFAPLIAPRGPQETDYNARLKPPSSQHWLGTDNLGKDILSRVIHGARIDLRVGIISVLTPFFIGVILGCFAGYYGGKIDT